MLFTPEEVSRVKLRLGYEEFPKYEADVNIALEKIQDVVRYERVISLLDIIDNIDGQILGFVQKYYLEEVEGIKLNYSKVIQGLKSEGTRRLQELAHQTALDIRHNPFRGGGSSFSMLAIP